MPRLALITLICLLTGCNHKPSISANDIGDTAIIPTDKKALYFPEKTFFTDSSSGPRYSFLLFLLREPILYQERRPVETYRLLCTPALSGAISIRLEKQDSNITMY